jgi:alpha-tubulin suppressor-like RCC1 family protein
MLMRSGIGFAWFGVRAGTGRWLALALAGCLVTFPASALPELAGITAIGAGANHTCALTTGGAVKCWGSNTFGQLGVGSIPWSLTPMEVTGLGSGVAAIAVGSNHACALTTGGVVKCWGDNRQIGNTDALWSFSPVEINGLGSGVAAIVAGGAHSCALTAARGVKCWGSNGAGQLGDNSTTWRPTPVDVSGLAYGVKAIAAGGGHTCAVTAGGGAKCWGYNAYGQLGDDSVTDRLAPVDVSGLPSGVAAISAGSNHTCALATGGGVKCWGSNAFGALGEVPESYDRWVVPVDVADLGGGNAAVSAGGHHTCALDASGSLKCWGLNQHGQVGDGTTQTPFRPVAARGLAGPATSVTAGRSHTCAMLGNGTAQCWGDNEYGQLGSGPMGWRLAPAGVAGLAVGVEAITTGTESSCALMSAGGVKCWGSNYYGQLGNDATPESNRPVEVTGLARGVVAISGSGGHACAIAEGGGVKCWGLNHAGQVGDDGPMGWRTEPVDVKGLGAGMAGVAAGGAHSCALTNGGGVKCWGANNHGQVGLPAVYATSSTPVDLPWLASSVSSVVAGGEHGCAILTGGVVRCWGSNASGQLGNGSVVDSATPTTVAGLGGGIAMVAAGRSHTCALSASGGIRCWGANDKGQLGDGSTAERWSPVKVTGLESGVTAIATGDSHTCAVTASGRAQCWGANHDGQLGDGTLVDKPAPVDVKGLPHPVKAIAAGGAHTCALATGGAVHCWGNNTAGAVGDGIHDFRPFPATVLAQAPETNYTALWWNPGEPGWGVNLNHQGEAIFATLFTYASDGEGLWLVASNLARQPDGAFTGSLYRTSGPPFNQSPWTPVSIAEVGRMTLLFSGAGAGTLTYDLDSTTVTKAIERQVFSSPVPACTAGTGSRAGLVNYQDLWWNPAEPGWGINLTHQGNIIFATLFTYSDSGRDAWMVASRLSAQADGAFTGTLYATSGPPFNASPWQPITITEVGTMTLRFSSGEAGSLDYAVYGKGVSKHIQRQVFGNTVPFCR